MPRLADQFDYHEFAHVTQYLASQPGFRRMARMATSGFTIVELLIVIVIIGILAAIVIVAYNGITNRAHDTAVSNDLASISKKLQIFMANKGAYPANATELEQADFKATQGSYLVRNNLYYCRSTDGQHFSMGAYSLGGARYWVVDGAVTKTTDNVYGDATCSKLDPYPHPTSVIDYGYKDGSSGWQVWTE